MKDYYKILELDFGVTQEHIDKQYRFLVHAWHPDKFPTKEQKIKAEERLKEINEANSILGDPLKRAEYDSELRTPSSPTIKPPKSEHMETKVTPTQPLYNYTHQCESCGLPAETKYVQFYENVGAIFFRYHRSIDGNFCKPCIEYYFFSLTGKTMLLGWWGIISFIITPFILINNLFRYIFTISLKKTSTRITPKPSIFWLLSTIVGFLLIGYFSCSIFSILFIPTTSSQSSSESPVAPINTAIPPKPIPSRTPTEINSPIVPVSNCIHWSNVDSYPVGQRLCVYGIIDEISSSNQVSTRIDFTAEPNTFFIYDANYVYPDLKEGDCVVADERLQLFDNRIPFMSVSDLYVCESWMK